MMVPSSLTPRPRLMAALLGLLTGLLSGCGRSAPPFAPELPAELQTLYAAAQTDPKAEAWVRIGNAWRTRRDWPQAVEAYERALSVDSDHADALISLAALRIAHGERDVAQDLIERIEKAYPDDARVQANLGDLYVALGQQELGLGSYRRALAADPAQPLALERLARAALAKGRADEARGYLQRLRTAAPDDPGTRALALDLARASGDAGGVEQSLRAAYQRDRNLDSLQALYRFYLTNNRAGEALALVDGWLADHPDQPVALLARAEALAATGETREARQLLTRLINRDEDELEPPLRARAHLALGQVLLDAGQNDSALAELTEVLDFAGSDTRLKLRVADLYAEADEVARADQIYRELISEDPRLVPDIASRRAVLMQQFSEGDVEEGNDPVEAMYVMSLRSQPRNVVTLNNLAFHYADQYPDDEARLKAARQMIDRAIELRGKDPNLMDTLGWVALRSGDLATAQEALAAAAAGRPDDAAVQYHRAVLLEAQGRSQEALAAVRRALQMSDDFVGRDDAQDLARRLEEGS